MKKVYLLIITTILISQASFAQLVQASIGVGSTASRFKIYLKSDQTQTPATISTLQFNIGLPQSVTPPTMTVATAAVGSPWIVSQATEGGFDNYEIYTAQSGYTLNMTAGVEVEIMEVEFSSAPAGPVALVTLPDGGTGNSTNLSLYFCSGTVNADGSNLYYTRAGTTVVNTFSYDEADFINTPGTGTSTATIGSAVTPLMYRTVQSGNWNNPATWETSPDGITWSPATATPTSADLAITIRNGHTVTNTSALQIDETTVQPQGMLITTDALTVQNQGLTFESDATFTGILGNSSGSVVGSVNVDRFIPARRAWRLMTPSVNSTETINASWQEGGNNAAGHGTQITGGSIANGFDQSTLNNPSIKTYNSAGNNFVGIASTNVSISSQPGYFLFVRGDRTLDLTANPLPAANATTLTVTGAPKMGLQSTSVGATGFTLVGNPYISPVDFSQTGKTNVADRFYVWDPKLNTVGAYVLFDGPGPNYTVTPGVGGSYPTSPAMGIIQTGQAFLVQGTGAGASIGINEDDKSLTQQNVFRNTPDGKDELLEVNLQFQNGGGIVTADATLARFNNDYSAYVNNEDAGKPTNVDENLAIERDGNTLMVEKRPLIDNKDEVVYLKMFNMKVRDYQFEIVPTHFINPGFTASLEDMYLNTSTSLSLTENTIVKFSVTNDAASKNPNRFKILFTAKGVVTANETPKTGIAVYPNPARDGFTFSMASDATAKGKVSLSLLNKAGQVVSMKEISSEQAAKYYYNLPALAAGTYTLNVYRGNTFIESKQIVIKK